MTTLWDDLPWFPIEQQVDLKGAGAVVVQDKINGHSCIFGFSAREL